MSAMIDWVWIDDISLSVLVCIISFVVILPIQLLLCFKAKSRRVRFIPITLFCVLAVVFICMALSSTGWDNIGYIFFAIYAVLMILACGIGGGIWAIINIMKKKNTKSL